LKTQLGPVPAGAGEEVAVKSFRTIGLAAVLALMTAAVLAVPSALAGGFVADQYPVTVSATPTSSALMNLGTGTACGWDVEAVTLLDAEMPVPPIGKSSGCGYSSMDTNGCKFVFHPGAGSKGTIDIGPAGCGPVIVTFKTCKRNIPAQSIPATYENIGTGSSAAVSVTVETHEMKYVDCFPSTLRSNGQYTDSWEFKATNAGGSPVGLRAAASAVFLEGEESSEPSKQPKIKTEWTSGWQGHTSPLVEDPALTVPHTFTLAGKTFYCSASHLGGIFEEEITHGAGFTVWPSYDGCTVNAGIWAAVNAKGCYYGVEMVNAGPPYSGNLSLACEPGKEMELKIYATEQKKIEDKAYCVYKVSSQEGINGIGLENVGSGLERGIAMNMNVKGIAYTVALGTPLNCGKSTGILTLAGGATLYGLK
jgi:hypothetical protein